MRPPPILIALAVTLLAAPLTAQERGMREPALAIRPLPAVLAPSSAGLATLHPRRDDPLALGLITGMLVGLTVGGTYGYLTYDDRCARVEDGCLLSRDVETVVFAAIGGSLGGLIGIGTMYLLDRRDPGRAPAPLAVTPDATGAMRVQVMLRH